MRSPITPILRTNKPVTKCKKKDETDKLVVLRYTFKIWFTLHTLLGIRTDYI